VGSFTLRDPVSGSALRDADNDTVRADAFVPPPPAPQPILGFPTLIVELGRIGGWVLGVSQLGVNTFLGKFVVSWDDITASVRHVTINRGRNHELNRVEAGRSEIRLANRNRAFDPTNTASPHYPDVRLMTPIRIRALWDGVTYPMFYGFATGWPQRWTRGPEGDAEVTVQLVDAFKILALAKVTLARPPETTGARIGAVLDAVGWPSNLRAIDNGVSTIQGVDLAAVPALTHIQDVATSEDGLFFIAADGVARFYASNHGIVLDDANDTWGDAGTEKHYQEIVLTDDDSQLWNEVTVTAPDLADQVVSDGVSISQFSGVARAPRSLPVSTLLNTEAAMLTRANAVLKRYSQPKPRIEQMALDGRAGSQWARLLVHDLHERVLVRKRPPGGGFLDQPSIIEGISHEISPNISWRTMWQLSSTNYQIGQWQLGVPGRSELGVTTILGGF
jgi:hypothetical protein